MIKMKLYLFLIIFPSVEKMQATIKKNVEIQKERGKCQEQKESYISKEPCDSLSK